jgi:hypothetical protein
VALYTLTPTAEDRARLQTNILKVWNIATPSQMSRGLSWYKDANDIARVMGDAKMGAGVIATLSAQRGWNDNIRLALDAAEGQEVRTVGDQQRKLSRILSGVDPAEVLPMFLKTGQFYQCILNPDHPSAVVIDRHAYDVAVGQFNGDVHRGLSYKKRYDIFAEAYRAVARAINVTPCQLQAVTWVVWTEALDMLYGKTHRGFNQKLGASE